MLAACERFWGCAAGCNVYLTPPGTQGFALHFDDIDAFVLQLSGTKSWKVYAPNDKEALLPRQPPTAHFEPGSHGDPVLEVDLTPGDLLYLPRGAPHQAVASPDSHSLHVTISTNQMNSWADLFEIAIPRALELAAEEHPALRQTLPLGFLSYMGVAHSVDEDEEHTALEKQKVAARQGFESLATGAPWRPAGPPSSAPFVPPSPIAVFFVPSHVLALLSCSFSTCSPHCRHDGAGGCEPPTGRRGRSTGRALYATTSPTPSQQQ
jgi:lysine-specific demethylase/histidyl-hydroxylase NO66